MFNMTKTIPSLASHLDNDQYRFIVTATDQGEIGGGHKRCRVFGHGKARDDLP